MNNSQGNAAVARSVGSAKDAVTAAQEIKGNNVAAGGVVNAIDQANTVLGNATSTDSQGIRLFI